MPIRHGQAYGANRKKIGLCLSAALPGIKRSGSVRSLAAIITKGLCLGLLAVSFTPTKLPLRTTLRNCPTQPLIVCASSCSSPLNYRVATRGGASSQTGELRTGA